MSTEQRTTSIPANSNLASDREVRESNAILNASLEEYIKKNSGKNSSDRSKRLYGVIAYKIMPIKTGLLRTALLLVLLVPLSEGGAAPLKPLYP